MTPYATRQVESRFPHTGVTVFTHDASDAPVNTSHHWPRTRDSDGAGGHVDGLNCTTVEVTAVECLVCLGSGDDCLVLDQATTWGWAMG